MTIQVYTTKKCKNNFWLYLGKDLFECIEFMSFDCFTIVFWELCQDVLYGDWCATNRKSKSKPERDRNLEIKTREWN